MRCSFAQNAAQLQTIADSQKCLLARAIFHFGSFRAFSGSAGVCKRQLPRKQNQGLSAPRP